MKYSDFNDLKISALGFGAMRMPTLPDGTVDMPLTEKMIDKAIASGINYFDTAWPYHAGLSEVIVGKLLAKYPRDSWYLANKYPGHQIMKEYRPAEIFEAQLKKCGVEYFDFYLLHNVYEKSIDTYLDERWGIIDYFLEQKRLGRIRHLGFSTHASPEVLARFLEIVGDKMEFCQIQLNYLDITLQRADEKLELLKKYGIPVWVMEPVRGGKLVDLPHSACDRLKARRPDESIAAWGFRWLLGIPEVKVVLSGMSNMEQLEDNIKTFSGGEPLGEDECAILRDIADMLSDSVPCTSCRYCIDGCPMKLDIPKLIGLYNELKFSPNVNTAMRIEALPEEQQPISCICCGRCLKICPQKIDIPGTFLEMQKLLDNIPSWAEVCKKRDEDQARNS